MNDEKEITLKELIKLAPDYMRIQNLESPHTTAPWLYASKDFIVRVDGDEETIEKTYRVTDLIISISVYGQQKPKSVDFNRYGNAEMLLCLLAHKPEHLHIAYHQDNQSENMKANNIHMETITIKGIKGKRTYQVTFNTPRTSKDCRYNCLASF